MPFPTSLSHTFPPKEADSLASPSQTVDGKDTSNPLMAVASPKSKDKIPA